MEQKVRKVGNSYGVLLPAIIVKKLKLSEGKKVYLEVYDEEQSLVIRLKRNLANGVTPQFLKFINKFNEEYHDALSELARR